MTPQQERDVLYQAVKQLGLLAHMPPADAPAHNPDAVLKDCPHPACQTAWAAIAKVTGRA